MTVVLVHGNPETASVWDLLVEQLVQNGLPEPVRLSPPGFGAAIPEQFDCTPRAYQDWLLEQLDQMSGPIDLVGHDWGGVHVAGVAMRHADLIRSWVSDALGVLAPDYTWHPLAQTWQTDGAGEAWIAEHQALSITERAAVYQNLGVEARAAMDLSRGFDSTMGQAILRLYRAAAQPAMADLGHSIDTGSKVPGLAVIARHDETVGTTSQRRSMARRVGVAEGHIEGGHWWMTEHDGRIGAQLLQNFWSSLPQSTTS